MGKPDKLWCPEEGPRAFQLFVGADVKVCGSLACFCFRGIQEGNLADTVGTLEPDTPSKPSTPG